jgi:hypothetical protein
MGKPYADLLDDTWQVGGDLGTLRESTRTGFFGEMPAFDHLSDEEIRRVVDYLRELRRSAATRISTSPPRTGPPAAPAPRSASGSPTATARCPASPGS